MPDQVDQKKVVRAAAVEGYQFLDDDYEGPGSLALGVPLLCAFADLYVACTQEARGPVECANVLHEISRKAGVVTTLLKEKGVKK